jgi:hypothetical protein
MYKLDPATRRNLHYAALPGKTASVFVVLLLCFFIGLLGTAVVAYVCGAIVRHFGGGF